MWWCSGLRARERSANVRLRVWAQILCCTALFGHRAGGAGDAAARAGALLAAGRPSEAAALAASCGAPFCQLVRARALFALGRLPEAALAVSPAIESLGAMKPHAEVLLGESLLLSGRPLDARGPLRAAAASPGPAGLRAAALLADALLATGNHAEARQQAEHAAALSGQPADVRAGMAWCVAQAAAAQARVDGSLAREAALVLRGFWLTHPDHPAAETARALERDLQTELPEPTGRELLLRASRLLSAGQPAAAAAQSDAAARMLSGPERAEAALLHARALAADGKRSDAAPFLQEAWQRGAPGVAAAAGLLLARDRARRGQDADAIHLADSVARKYPAAPEAEESVLFTARLLVDEGRRWPARQRLAALAARRGGAYSSSARWMLAWMSYQDHLRDAAERFAEFASSAAGDEERAQGTYWQARAGDPGQAPPLLRRAAELDPLGWYGLLARGRLEQIAQGAAPFPPQREPGTAPPALDVAMTLASLGLLSEAAAEADWFVQHHPGDAGAQALPVYERAGRYDRSVVIAQSLLGGRGARAPKVVLDAAYPAAFPAEVARSAERTGIDPYLLLAVMRRESLFKPDTRSVAGAVGLLQLLPATARRAAIILGRPALRDDELTTPSTAIDLGAWYLAELLGRFGDAAPALAAYNAGPRVAGPWAARGAGREVDEWVEDIPYRETRRYVKVVVGAWSAYRILAGGAPPALAQLVPAPRNGANF